jgi:hypothetical protein
MTTYLGQTRCIYPQIGAFYMGSVDLDTRSFEIQEASGSETLWTSKPLYFPAMEPIRTLGSAMEDPVCT